MEKPISPNNINQDKWTDLRARTTSSFAIAGITLAALWIGGVIFACLIIFAAITMMKEWEFLTKEDTKFMQLFGYAYVILPCASILWLRSDANAGFKLNIALIALISATDIAAYFVGKKFGRTKLAPTISPGKTFEGLAGGVVAAILTGLLMSAYTNVFNSFFIVAIASGSVAILAQAGDLFKSWIKRKAGVKDSGTILPGHGGLIDRLDGYMFTAPLLALIYYLR